MNYIRQARYDDIERIAEILVFNYRLNFYPIFRDDCFYFEELTVAKQTTNYMNELDSIWVYDDGVVLVVHRIVEIDDAVFIAKGDANNSNDKEYSVNLIKGEVIKVIPDFGVVQEVFTNPIVQTSCIVIAVVLFELSFRLDKKDKVKSNDELQEEIDRLKAELHGKEE